MEQIPIDGIDLPRRPARRFLGDIPALAESMNDYGLQQPISVRADGARFILTSGMRRLAAARMLQWESIPGLIRSVSADDAYLLDLIENLQREDLSPEEEADALRELIRTRGWTLQQVADAVKRSVAYVSKRVRLFEDPQLREAVAEKGLPVSTAEVLLAVDANERGPIIARALAERWDQLGAREALRSVGSAIGDDVSEAESAILESDDGQVVPGVARTPARRAGESRAAGRPRGLTRAVRSFHELLMSIRAEDPTQSDRAALRSLFRDLVLLARAPSKRMAPVFPPLPRVAGSSGSASALKPRTGQSRSRKGV